MAVRYSAESQTHSRTVSLGSVSALTMASWVKVAVDRNANQVWLCLDNGNTSYWALGTNADGVTAQAFAHNAASGTAMAMTVGEWYYVALAENGANGSLWMRAVNTDAWTTVTWTNFGTPITGTNLRLGRHPATGLWFNGALASIKIWTEALTLEQVERESRQYLPMRVSTLRAWYPMLTTSTVDYSGNDWALSGGTGSTSEDGPPIRWGGLGVANKFWVGSDAVTPFYGWGVPA